MTALLRGGGGENRRIFSINIYLFIKYKNSAFQSADQQLYATGVRNCHSTKKPLKRQDGPTETFIAPGRSKVPPQP